MNELANDVMDLNGVQSDFKVLIISRTEELVQSLDPCLEALGLHDRLALNTIEGALKQIDDHRLGIVFMDGALREVPRWHRIGERITDRGAALVYIFDQWSEDILDPELYSKPFTSLKQPVGIQDLRNAVEIALYKARIERERRNSEQELKESERRYRLLAANVDDIIWATDRDLRFTYVSPSVTRVLGYEPDYGLGRHILEILPPSVHDVLNSRIDRARSELDKRGGRPFPLATLEYELLRQDGTSLMAEVHISFLQDETGEVIGLVGVARDISLRKQAENALRQRIEIERFVSGISTKFINLSAAEIDRAISEVLGEIGRFVNADRCYILMIDTDRSLAVNTHEWCDHGVDSLLEDRKAIDPAAYPWLSGQCFQGEIVNVPSASSLPEEAAATRDGFKMRGVQSLLFVPVICGQEMLGVLGMESVRREREWSEHTVTMIKMIGEIIANTLVRKRSDEALRLREEQSQVLLNATQGVAMLLDRSGRVLSINESGAQRLGRPANEIVGSLAIDFAPPDLYDALKQLRGQVCDAGCSKEFRFDNLGGQWRAGVYPIKNRDGLVTQSAFFADDITERVLAEEALRDSEEKYRILVENASDAILIVQDEFIRFHNRKTEEAFGYSAEELAANPFLDYVHPDDRCMVKSHHYARLQGEAMVVPYSVRILRRDGQELWGEVNAVRINWQGKPAILAVLRDLTDQKKLENRLQQIQKMEAIATLAGGMAHDFNNLLMSIQGNSSLMLLDIDPGHPHYDYLTRIEKQVQSGANLTRQLLGYARKGRYEVQPLDLNQLVRDTMETFARTRREIIIRLDLDPRVSFIEADQGQLEQVLLNLAINASDAMPGGGELLIKTKNVSHHHIENTLYVPKTGEYVLLTVTDQGIGMDSETMERIFDPFFTTKEMGRGTGLGLASVYGIIKGHEGYIDVKSRLGQGATFNLYFPVTEKEAAEPVSNSDPIISGSGTILLVDDERSILEVGRLMLEKLGYKVFVAESGEQALDLYTSKMNLIDLVVLDLIMPGMSGGEVYDHLREISPDLKAILSSGYSIDGQAKEILKRGCKGFIQKPYDLQALSSKIDAVLKSRDDTGLVRSEQLARDRVSDRALD